jgi:hypothetical protein
LGKEPLKNQDKKLYVRQNENGINSKILHYNPKAFAKEYTHGDKHELSKALVVRGKQAGCFL